MVQTKSQPLRTCVGCRRRAIQAELLRMVAVENDGGKSVVVDAHRRMAGRGAWLHPGESCLVLAVKRRAFNRAFRGAVDTDAVELYFNATEPRRITVEGSRTTVQRESGQK